MLREWTLSKLEAVKESSRVVVWDSLRLLSEADGMIDSFASQNGYTVIMAATNLAFRDLYEQAIADQETKKLLVIDRAPQRRRTNPSVTKAPPPFYPDLLADTPPQARIHLDLRQFLKEKTGDRNWPQEVNEPRYARLIAYHLEGVLRGHQNLRTAHESRFTDNDFKRIVAFAALGVAESAFKQLDAQDYWTIGLLGHDALAELDELAPEITKPIRDELAKAPAPFCWFANRDADLVIRAFYLSVILSQHTENWNLLLANIDPVLSSLSGAKVEILREAAPKLIALDPVQATNDLETVENSLTRDALQLLLLDQLHLSQPESFTAMVEKERYSTLFRCLALLLALDNLLSPQPAEDEQTRIAEFLFPEGNSGEARWVDTRGSVTWSDLKKAYQRATTIGRLREALANIVKTLKVRKTEQLTFKFFLEWWNKQQLNCLEYYLSDLERLVDSAELLPRPDNELPSVFINALDRIRQRVRLIAKEVHQHLDEVNRRFQDIVAMQYPTWIAKDGDVYLTSQFIRRCIKPHWDSQNERAVVFIFDGMRYDIWDELLKPMLENQMKIIADLPAVSLLPSETHISRWALASGTEPQHFLPRQAENLHLKEALMREFNYQGAVEAVAPEGSGIGETVRYKAGNLEYFIFEFCDKELHKIQIKKLPDGREVPSRSLAFIYQQQLKNIIDNEVMSIVRSLPPGTKVFITADHGFGPVGRQPLWFDEDDLNEASDCVYLNCLLKETIGQANIPSKVRDNVIAFRPEQLGMPTTESRTTKAGQVIHKEYKAVVFPKVGYSFSRPKSHYNPDAYSHGGISIQELVIPMLVLQVKPKVKGVLTLEPISSTESVVEGEDIEFRMRLNRSAKGSTGTEELRVEIEASYGQEAEHLQLPRQVLYVPVQGTEVVYHFRPDVAKATRDEQLEGVMERIFTLTVSYQEGRKTIRNSQTKSFSVKLNSERVVRRVPAHLGNILGLTPKTMR